jgi:hypothetical protein
MKKQNSNSAETGNNANLQLYAGGISAESKIRTMDFQQFKKEWADAMVYKPKDFDYENTMHELYIEYKESLRNWAKGMTVKQWCEFFHEDCDLDQHPYMLKERALKTKHGNGLKEMANRFRNGVGLPPIPLIDETKH